MTAMNTAARPRRNNRIRLTLRDRVFKTVVYFVITLFAMACFYPVLAVILYSIMPYTDYIKNPINIFPHAVDLSAYQHLLGVKLVHSGFRNSIIITVAGTLINITLMCLSAYPLSKKDLKGRNAVLIFITITMFFNGGMIPNYYLVRALHMINTLWALIIPGVLSAYNLILMKNFISEIPASLEESAYIDGANEFQILCRIIVPVSMPAIATFIIFYAVGQWNSYFSAVMYTTKKELWTLMLILRELVVEDSMDLAYQGVVMEEDKTRAATFTMKMAIIVIATAPIICVYPFLQRFFTKGIMVGSVKG